MSLSFCVLGSGSQGNCTLLTLDGGTTPRRLLVDSGLSPRATTRRLEPLGLGLGDIDDICLTHLDADHFAPGWVKAAPRHEITIHLHFRHRARAERAGLDGRYLELFDDNHDLDAHTTVEPLLFAHDALGTVGFIFEHAGTRFAIATDLGRVTRTLTERFTDLHGLAIESNYDRAMQLDSDRPAMLKRRIMGGRGHLCNEETLGAVITIAKQSRLSHIALLHVSRHCNDPELIRRLYQRRAPHLLDRLTISSQHDPTPVFRVRGPGVPAPGEQLAMF